VLPTGSIRADSGWQRGASGGDEIIKSFMALPRPDRGYVILLAVVAGAVIVSAAYSYRAINRELTESVLSRRASVSYLAAAVLAEKFDRLVDIGISLGSRVSFRELVEAGEWRRASEILSGVSSDFPFVDRLALIDPSGTLRADIPAAPEVSGKNFSHRDWFPAVMASGRPYISRIYQRTALPMMKVFVAAVPIKRASGETLGILVVQVRLDKFFDWTRKIEVGSRGFVYVVDSRGILAAHPKHSSEGALINYSSVPVVQQVIEGKRGVETSYDPIEGDELVVAYEPIAKYGWGVVIAQPADAAFAARDD